MTKDEALKLALEALESWNYLLDPKPDEKTITAIKEALAQPEQEPVAWRFINGSNFRKRRPDDFADLDSNGLPYWNPLYTTPPKREWVGLTAQEAADCWTTSATKTWHNFEAALRSKNT